MMFMVVVSELCADGAEKNLLGEQFRQDDWIVFFAGRIEKVEWNADSVKLGQLAGDLGVAVGPVGQHGNDTELFERFAHSLGVDGGAQVKFAGDAPVGGEVEKDGTSFGQLAPQFDLGKRDPRDAVVRSGGGFFRQRGSGTGEEVAGEIAEAEKQGEQDGQSSQGLGPV